MPGKPYAFDKPETIIILSYFPQKVLEESSLNSVPL
jgi:hypothetical protein